MFVEVDDEVHLAVEPASEFVGVHVAERALLRRDGLRIDHFKSFLTFLEIVWISIIKFRNISKYEYVIGSVCDRKGQSLFPR